MKNNDYMKLYTDGACKNNDIVSSTRKGGFCSILKYDDKKLMVHGKGYNTTNNRMEMQAIIEGLKKINEIEYDKKITIYTDSKFIKHAFQHKWINKWQHNKWKTVNNTDVKNKDLWYQLIELTKNKDIEFRWVKGHNGNVYNEQCDCVARGNANDENLDFLNNLEDTIVYEIKNEL